MILTLVSICGYAQELEISVSPSPVGSGARAAGMADAFVAIADDATAASWNPAGLVQLERPEFSLVGAWNGVFERFDATGHPEVDSTHSSDNLDLNFASLTWPLPVLVFGRNAVAGVYYQQKYNFSRQFNFDYTRSTMGSRGLVLTRMHNVDFDQEGALSAITPAFAMELTHRLSIGVGVNLWRSSFLAENGWEQTTRIGVLGMAGSDVYQAVTRTYERYEDVEGENVTVGALWSLNDRWSLGARYDSGWEADARYSRTGSTWQSTFAIPGAFDLVPIRERKGRILRFPSTLAIGAAHRFNDRFTLSCDVSRTDWNDFWYKNPRGDRYSLVDNANLDRLLFKPKYDPTYTVRLGAEYVFIPKHPEETLNRLWSLRGGVFYDQEPASGKPDEFWGAALGVGLLVNQRVNIDLAWQIRHGDGVNGDFVRGVSGFEEDVWQHRLLISTVVYF